MPFSDKGNMELAQLMPDTARESGVTPAYNREWRTWIPDQGRCLKSQKITLQK